MQAQRGQAAVELVAVLPLVLALFARLWRGGGLVHAARAGPAAARSAARAEALGLPPGRAARAPLPARLEHGMRVRVSAGGRVRVTARVPSTFGLHVGSVSSSSRFAPQR